MTEHMEKSLSVALRCISMRSGVEIWLEERLASQFEAVLLGVKASQFVKVAGQVVNTADVTGLFDAATVEEYRRRRNGEWQCREGGWHQKGAECGCRPERGAGRPAEWEETVMRLSGMTDAEKEARIRKLDALRKDVESFLGNKSMT
jgi:hypothetical protein